LIRTNRISEESRLKTRRKRGKRKKGREGPGLVATGGDYGGETGRGKREEQLTNVRDEKKPRKEEKTRSCATREPLQAVLAGWLREVSGPRGDGGSKKRMPRRDNLRKAGILELYDYWK